MGLLASRRLHHPRGYVGRLVPFCDGSTARVYREIRIDVPRVTDPCVLVVGFVLRGVRGSGHVAFQWESWLNTVLFAGFPGLVSKLWMAHDEHGLYRGVYEWDGADRARRYVDALNWVLGLVCAPGSIRAHIVPGMGREQALRDPAVLDADGAGQWWRPARPVAAAR